MGISRATEWTTSAGNCISVVTSAEHGLDNQGNRRAGWTREIEQTITIDGERKMG